MPEQNGPLKSEISIEDAYKGIVREIEYFGKQLDENINLGGDFLVYVEDELENYNRMFNFLLTKGESAL